MKKIISMVLFGAFALSLVACGAKKDKPLYSDANETEQVVVKEDAIKDGKLLDYSENPDGTFEADGITYKYKLGISGRMPNASKDSFFVYLSNLENITFEQAWKAAGFSSNSNDYFDVKDAVLVEWRTEN